MGLAETFTVQMLILFIISLICCGTGFSKINYFRSLGYGLSTIAMEVAVIVMFKKYLSITQLVSCILLIIYGARILKRFLAREKKKKDSKSDIKKSGKVPFLNKLIAWLCFSVLYLCQISPVVLRVQGFKAVIDKLNMYFVPKNTAFSIIGVIAMAVGLALLICKDLKKLKISNINVIGEIAFWIGLYMIGFNKKIGFVPICIMIIGFLFMLYRVLVLNRRKK